MNNNKPQCGLILENREGKVLLQLRDNRPDILFPNVWGTFGGEIEDGETPEMAIMREIREETRYELHDPEYFDTFLYDSRVIHIYRKVDHTIALEDLTIHEGQKGMFFSKEEVENLDCAAHCKEIVIAYFQKFHQ
ncbi:MAG: NUDIX domain-containing protein [Proteobacteria bacterium]|nr:NUDIX domain-containing protein [Pseudomonadota bacterium]